MFDNILNRGTIIYRVLLPKARIDYENKIIKFYCVFDHFLGLFKFFECNESCLNLNLLFTTYIKYIGSFSVKLN